MKLRNITLAAVLISAAIVATKDACAQAGPPSPPVANPATYVASYSFTARWSSVSGATGYRLDVSTSSSFGIGTYVTDYQNRDVGNATNRSVTLLNASTTYYYRVRAYNGAGTSSHSNVVSVTTLNAMGPPVVITNPASLVASFSATLNGSVDPHGFPTTVRFEYGTTTNYGQTTPSQNRNGHTFQNVSANIPQLNANTTYHFRIVATNNGVTTNGLDRTFRTLAPNGPPVVITNPASLVASFSATLNGSVDPHGFPTTVRFEYGTTTNYGQTTPSQNRNGHTFQNVSANIPQLNANTTYHFRIVATNNGVTTNGLDRTFRTLAPNGPPVVITNPASLVASFSATLNGSVDPHGFPTTVRFEYGTTTNYGQTTPSQNRNGHTFQNVSANIPQLNANTTYHFRIVATNNGVTTNGLDRTFRTLAPNGPPVVITNPASLVASFSATLNGSVDPHGFPTTVRFEYGTTTNYGQTTPSQNRNGHTFQNVSANIPQLNANTTYHFRIVATNNGVTTNGLDRTFRTLASSTPTPTPTPFGTTPTPTPSATVTPTPTPFGTTPTPTPRCDWIKRAPVPYAARGIFAASDDTYVYCGGGYDGTTAHADLLRYDPAANSWTPLASSPDQHFLSQAVFFNNKIYNIGGFGSSGGVTNTTRIYDVAANSWTTGAPMPVALSNMATALWNGIIYVAGGYDGVGAVNTLYAYDIATNTWNTRTSMPQALFLSGFGAINGKLYIAAGNNGTIELNTLYIYNIATNTWSTGADVPTAVTGPGSSVFCGGLLWLYGGGFPTTLNITQIYSPEFDTWYSGNTTPNMNVNRLWFYGTAIDNTSIVAPGGDTVPGTPVNENEQLVCECKIDAEANSKRDSDSATNVYRNSNSDADSWLSRRQLPWQRHRIRVLATRKLQH